MTNLTTYINEWNLNNNSIHNVGYKYNYFPESPEELRELVAERLEKNTESPYLLDIDTSKITDFTDLFSGYENDYLSKTYKIDCWQIKTLNLLSWNTSNVTTMYGTFCYLPELRTLNIINFDTHNVTDMSMMFCDCKKLKELYINFNTCKVEEMRYMFDNCRSLKEVKNIEKWDISNVVRTDDIFRHCSLLNIPSWYENR